MSDQDIDTALNNALKPILYRWNVPSAGDFRRMRVGLNISIDDLSHRSGIAKSSIYKFEQGGRPEGIHSENLRKLVESMRELSEGDQR